MIQFLLIFVEYLIHLRVRKVLVKVIIYLCCRSPAARANAFHFFQREQAVFCSALVPNAKLLFAMFKQLLATAEHARDVGAYLHVVLPARFGGQHRVVTDDVADFQFGEIHSAREFRDHLSGQPTGLILRIEQRRHERRASSRIMRQHLRKPRLEFFGKTHYLSISPSTTSMLPIAATTS